MHGPTVPKREEKRSRVFLVARVDAANGLQDARVRDISRNGALLESDVTPAFGESIQVKCGRTTLQSRVAWVDRGWYGVEFETPLVMRQLVDEAGTKLKVSAPRNYRSGKLPEQAERNSTTNQI